MPEHNITQRGLDFHFLKIKISIAKIIKATTSKDVRLLGSVLCP